LINEFQLTHDDIAKRVGRSRTTITNVLRLLNLESEIKELLQSGKLEMGHARALLSLAAKEQIKVAHIVVDKQLSVRETERLVQKIKNPVPVLRQPSEELVDWADKLSNRLSDKLSNTVKINVNHKGEGRVIINFLSPDEVDWLERVLDV
jgi:ParB family chromosome partitioning protein